MRCCVPFCKSDSRVDYFYPDDNKISMHDFPKDERIKEAWIHAIGREGEPGKFWRPGMWSVICSRHFTNDNYKPGLKRRRLFPDAVPSIFEDYPPHRQKRKDSRIEIKKHETSFSTNNSTTQLQSMAQLQPTLSDTHLQCTTSTDTDDNFTDNGDNFTDNGDNFSDNGDDFIDDSDNFSDNGDDFTDNGDNCTDNDDNLSMYVDVPSSNVGIKRTKSTSVNTTITMKQLTKQNKKICELKEKLRLAEKSLAKYKNKVKKLAKLNKDLHLKLTK